MSCCHCRSYDLFWRQGSQCSLETLWQILAGNKIIAALEQVCMWLWGKLSHRLRHVNCRFLLAHCCCSLFTTCFNAATHQISRNIVACKQHIKAARLIGGGALSVKTGSRFNQGHTMLQLNLLLQHAHLCCCCRLTTDARMMRHLWGMAPHQTQPCQGQDKPSQNNAWVLVDDTCDYRMK